MFVNTPLSVCEQRDSKGLYEKARAGKIRGFTGIDSPFEAPRRAELELHTERQSVAQCVQLVLEHLYDRHVLPERAVHRLCGEPVRELFVTDCEERTSLMARVATLPRIELDEVAYQWAHVLAEGWATPLSGFMRERQYLQSLHFGKLCDLHTKCTEPGAVNDASSSGWFKLLLLLLNVMLVLYIRIQTMTRARACRSTASINRFRSCTPSTMRRRRALASRQR